MRFPAILIATLLFVTAGCSSSPPSPDAAKPTAETTRRCFLLYDVKKGTFDKVVGEEVCREAFPACSTFKVPLAVIAFDAKALPDETTVLKWDKKKRERDAENRDHDARGWMRDSIVWFSQRITTTLGKKKLQKYLDAFGYGNRDLSSPQGLTQAWLVRPNAPKGLKITAYEQIEFLKKLWRDALPASPRAMRLARDLTLLETSPNGFVLHGKTGSNFYDDARKLHFGWFVAHVQKGDQEYIAVTNFRDTVPVDLPGYGGLRAKEMTKQSLREANLW